MFLTKKRRTAMSEGKGLSGFHEVLVDEIYQTM